MNRHVLALLPLLAVAGLAIGSHCHSLPAYPAGYYARPYYQPVYTYQLALPFYSASYYDPTGELRDEVKSLRAELKQQREQPQKLGVLASPSPKQGPPTELESRVSQVLKANHCAACHNPDTRKGGLTLFDPTGDLAAGTDWQLVFAKCVAGDMPPRAKHPEVSVEGLKVLAEMAKQTRKGG